MVDGAIPDCDYVCYVPQSALGVNTVSEKFFIDIPRVISILSSKDIYVK